MALSRQEVAVLCIFASIAIGIGGAIAVKTVDPKLLHATGGIALGLAGISSWMVRRSTRGREERAAFELHDPIATVPTTPPRPVEMTDTTSTKVHKQPAGKSSKVRCIKCQHVQVVPVSQKTFTCKQCNAHLKRRTAPAKSI